MRNGTKSQSRASNGEASVDPGGDNVFADLGLDRPELRLAKAALVARIRELVAGLGLTQAAAAKRLRIDRASLSALLRGSTESYSMDQLLRFLEALGQSVEITIHPKCSGRPGLVVR